MNRSARVVRCAAAAGLIVVFSTLASVAGPLDPPDGPVVPTFKTLGEVEPRVAVNSTKTPGDADSLFRITQPGSYYLTGNITGAPGRHGIEIAASGVTLDLMGFDLVGVEGSLDGVHVSAPEHTIAVLNGSVRDWGGNGVDASGAAACRLADLRAWGNAGIGIAAGASAVVTGCTARSNAGTGIDLGGGSTITGCTAAQNATGIVADEGCTISGCSAESSSADGILCPAGACTITGCSASSNAGSGITANLSAAITGCTAQANALDGIRVTSACIVRANTCDLNGNGGDGAGIHASGGDNRIEGNACARADRGVDIDAAGNIIVGNSCTGNATDWTIAADNIYGPIIDRRTPASAAVSGFAAAGTLSSTDPHANFSH